MFFVVSRTIPTFPRSLVLPSCLFLAGTFLSLLFSPEPLHGLPQIKKMFVFSMLLILPTVVRNMATIRQLFAGWYAIGAAVAIFGVTDFVWKLYTAHVHHFDLYRFYMSIRFTGFMSHPMTFAGQSMVILLLLIAFVLFAPTPTTRGLSWVAAIAVLLLGAALLVNGTRTVWLGTGVSGTWLLWRWKRWASIVGPGAVLALLSVPSGPIHERFLSLLHPQKNVDSNEFRIICIRTGIRMIEVHPIFGIGLDETKYHFLDYLPPDTPNPRPPGFYQHLHNVYLQYAAERGIPTMLIAIWVLVTIIRDFDNASKALPTGRSVERYVLNAAIAGLIGVMVSGLFEVNLGDSEVLTIFLVVVGCGYIAAETVNRRTRDNYLGSDPSPDL
jgi:putative inorganic carbon (HCO3(-)) transporter